MTVFIILLVVVIGLFLGGNHFYNFALNRKVDKTEVLEGNDHDADLDKNLIENQNWFDKNKKEVSITSVTGNSLVGYEFLNNSEKFVIILHGYVQDARAMATYIKKFYNLGFNVLAPDLLAHGKSGGETITMGSYDSKDLIKWCDYINDNYKDKKIILFGISMGAATVINSLDKNPPKNVMAFIEDSGYVKLENLFVHQWEKLFHIPKFPLLNMASLVTKIRGGYTFGSVNAIDGLRDTNIPGLVIHGDKDDFVPLENAFIIYENIRGIRELCIFEGLGHVEGAIKEEEAYWDRIESFLSNL